MNGIRRDLRGLRVLIVEDEAMLAMLLEDILSDFGCEVVSTASRFEDAMDKASILPLDIALLDVNLGGTQSFPIARTLDSRKVPFVYATAYGAFMPDDAPPAPIVSKPFALSDLTHAMSVAVGIRPDTPEAVGALIPVATGP